MACDDDYEVDEAVWESIEVLHEAELFLDLDERRIKHLMRLGDEGELNITADELRSVVEAHLRTRHEGITLSAWLRERRASPVGVPFGPARHLGRLFAPAVIRGIAPVSLPLRQQE